MSRQGRKREEVTATERYGMIEREKESERGLVIFLIMFHLCLFLIGQKGMYFLCLSFLTYVCVVTQGSRC